MTSFILDASVSLAWAFEDEESPYADDVIGSLASRRATVPPIWPLEMINGLLSAIRRGRIGSTGATRLIAVLDRLPLEIDREPPRATIEPRILDIGITNNLSSYDASYLDLTMRRGLPLATQDARLAKAAAAVGVSILQP